MFFSVWAVIGSMVATLGGAAVLLYLVYTTCMCQDVSARARYATATAFMLLVVMTLGGVSSTLAAFWASGKYQQHQAEENYKIFFGDDGT